MFSKSQNRGQLDQESLMKTYLLRAHYLGFECSGWIVLIKSEILVMMEWSGCSVLTKGKRHTKITSNTTLFIDSHHYPQ